MTPLEVLINHVRHHNIYQETRHVLEDAAFSICSGSGSPTKHHYGDGGLVRHTLEVVGLCQSTSKTHSVDRRVLYTSAIWHDYGKIFDYVKRSGVWVEADHKRDIHHVSRSAIEFNKHAATCGLPQEFVDAVTHCILAHHGLKEWGSPVQPKSKEAWLLHFCDGISARLDELRDDRQA